MKPITYGSLIVLVMLTQGGGMALAAGAGTSAAEILRLGVGARATAMGDAYTAQADDVSSLYWNPAGLALMQERQASFMYSKLLEGLSYQNAGIGIPLENGAIGGNISYLNYGQISGYGPNGEPLGDQTANSMVGTLGAAWLGNQWALGTNLKGIQETLADEKATAAAFDVGGTVIYPKPVAGGTLRFGAVIQNIGSKVKFLEQSDPLPTQWKVGVAAVRMMDKHLNLSLDVTGPRDDSMQVQSGAEYWLVPNLALRGGYVKSNNEGQGLRAGIGLRYKSISFDYAYAGYGDLGITHRYELTLRFGEPRPILTPEENKIMKQARAAQRNQDYQKAVLLYDSLIEMEPRYTKARRLVRTAMAQLESQQKDVAMKQGITYQPTAENSARKPALSELDELEQLLSIGTPQAAQAPKPTGGTNNPSDAATEVR